MKSIIIRGRSGDGKSTTARELCKSLNPEEVWRLNINHHIHSESKLTDATVSNIFDNTFIIQVKGHLILICAGAPTEQYIRILILIQICVEYLKLKIDFVIVSMRSVERKKGFNTPVELAEKSTVVHRERIEKIEGEDFLETQEWKNRIEKLKNIILRGLAEGDK